VKWTQILTWKQLGTGMLICLRNKKRRSFNLIDPSSLMTMTSSSNPIPSLAHTNTPNHVVPTLMHTLTSPINIHNNKNISGSTIVGTSSSISLLWFHYPSTYKLCDCSMPNDLFLVGFQPPRNMIYINRERLHNLYI